MCVSVCVRNAYSNVETAVGASSQSALNKEVPGDKSAGGCEMLSKYTGWWQLGLSEITV